MNDKRITRGVKRFLGPIVCVAFAYLFMRWTVLIIAVAEEWPWCNISPPPPQTYVLAAIGAISFGFAPLWLFGYFAFVGWQLLRTPDAR